MRFIFLDRNGDITSEEMIKSVNIDEAVYLSPLSEYRCCSLYDPILGEIKLAVTLNYGKGVSKFVVNNCEIHSIVRFSVREKNQLQKFFQKYT